MESAIAGKCADIARDPEAQKQQHGGCDRPRPPPTAYRLGRPVRPDRDPSATDPYRTRTDRGWSGQRRRATSASACRFLVKRSCGCREPESRCCSRKPSEETTERLRGKRCGSCRVGVEAMAASVSRSGTRVKQCCLRVALPGLLRDAFV